MNSALDIDKLLHTVEGLMNPPEWWDFCFMLFKSLSWVTSQHNNNKPDVRSTRQERRETQAEEKRRIIINSSRFRNQQQLSVRTNGRRHLSCEFGHFLSSFSRHDDRKQKIWISTHNQHGKWGDEEKKRERTNWWRRWCWWWGHDELLARRRGNERSQSLKHTFSHTSTHHRQPSEFNLFQPCSDMLRSVLLFILWVISFEYITNQTKTDRSVHHANHHTSPSRRSFVHDDDHDDDDAKKRTKNRI